MEKQGILLESGTNELELLTFLLGNQSFAMNVLKVQSIQQYDSSTLVKIPGSHHAMLGMILYRERTIPLIDLPAALGIDNKNITNKGKIVIVAEFNNVLNGFLVDGVNRINRMSWTDFVPINSIFSNVGASVCGTIQIENKEALVVDLEHIIATISPDLAIRDITDETLNLSKPKLREDISLFFAEDSNTIRNNVLRILKKAGYKNIRGFDNGQDAFDALVEICGRIDANAPDDAALPHVMISDIEMPRMDGLTLCRKMKSDNRFEKIVVVMFSSLINEQMVNKCESVGADSYITKPEMDKLVTILDELCLKEGEIPLTM